MANLTLVYGLRLLPSEEVAEVGDATLKLKNGREAHVTMHVLEGSKDEIEKQLKTSLEAFFDFYPEIRKAGFRCQASGLRPHSLVVILIL